MTWRTLTNKDPKNKVPTHCLVCWPEEDSLSIVAVKKIVTPRLDDLAPDTFCKVKGWEQCLCKVVVLGSEREVKAAMNEMHKAESAGGADEPPPKKKSRTETAKKLRTGKENRTSHCGKGKGTTKKIGSIIVVSGDSSTPAEKPSDPADKAATSPPEPCDTATTLPLDLVRPPLKQLQPNNRVSSVIADPSDDPRSPQMQQQVEEQEERENSVNGNLLINMTVDDNCKRLEYLEAGLIKLQAADADKSQRIRELEATVARLEAALEMYTSIPPAIPPKGVPPSPRPSSGLGPPPLSPLGIEPSAMTDSESSPPPLPPPLSPLGTWHRPLSLSHTPCAPDHPPTLSHTPCAPDHPPPTLARTPCAPDHPPPTLARTPCAPDHPPPVLSHTPCAPNHPPPTLPLTPHHPPPQHPPRQLHQRESQEQTQTFPTLSSSAIPKSILLPISTVVHNNVDLVGKEGKMTTLAVALAKEAFFGEEVMGQCTAKGYGGKPGLPHKEMMLLKEEIRKLYPNYWNNPLVFEEKWNKCSEQISQACKRIRTKRRKKGLITD